MVSQVALVVSNLPANSGDAREARSPGEENGNPLQYSCLENPMDRETWGATVHGVAKSRTQLIMHPRLVTYPINKKFHSRYYSRE